MAEPSAFPEPGPLPAPVPLPAGEPAAVLRWLQEGHERFLEGHSLHPHSTRERMRAVVEGQHPLAAVLGCADSRVPVELLFDSGFGDLFVVRNAGTMSTTAAIASLEYAVGHLDVSLVVVLGHEACGAVSAAMHPELLLEIWCIPACCSPIGCAPVSWWWWRATTTCTVLQSIGWAMWSQFPTQARLIEPFLNLFQRGDNALQ